MPTITLPDVYDTKLKQLVTERILQGRDPFEQTRESIIKELIDAEFARRQNGKPASASPAVVGDEIRLNVSAPDSLMHSKVVSATVDGHEIHRPKWNTLREELHLLALKRLGSFLALQKASDARLRPGKYELDGFKYIPQGDFSIQGVDANLCWAHSLKLAKVLNLPLQLRIVWRDKDGAVHPGKTGILDWSPTKQPA